MAAHTELEKDTDMNRPLLALLHRLCWEAKGVDEVMVGGEATAYDEEIAYGDYAATAFGGGKGVGVDVRALWICWQDSAPRTAQYVATGKEICTHKAT